MKKFFKGFMLIFILICTIALSACGSGEPTESAEDIQAKLKYEYFDVVEMINNNDYDNAKARIDEVYADTTDYSSTKGYNKTDLLCTLYEKQEMYDNAMDELLKMISDEGYIRRIEEIYSIDDENVLTEKASVKMTIDRVNDLLEKVSPAKKAEALKILSQDIFTKYSNKE